MLRASLVGAGLLVLISCGAEAPAADSAAGAATAVTAAASSHTNPLIALHEAGQPVLGLYAPSPGGGRGRGG